MKYLLLLSLIACSSGPKPLSDKAKELEVFSNRPTNCFVVSKVVGTDKMGSKDVAKNQMLNAAADAGASGVFIDQEVPNGNNITVYGTAYKCD